MSDGILDLRRQLKATKDPLGKTKIKGRIFELTEKVEGLIRHSGREINYNVKDWPIELLIKRYSDGLESEENELFIPDYQRDYKWDRKTLSRFVESILLDFPIPYLYVADVSDDDNPDLDGRIEIIDGSQRIRALHYFMNEGIKLKDTKEITELEGFQFTDLTAGRRRRFMRATLKVIELRGDVDEDTRRDLFERINSGAKSLVAMEVRHGSQEADSVFFTKVIVACAESNLFNELAPLSDKKKANQDHLELVLRFFAYLNHLEGYKGTVKPFLDEYLHIASEITEEKQIQGMYNEFMNTMNYINDNFPFGFRRTPSSKTTTRARYEALAVGTALALRVSPSLATQEGISDWIVSEEFQIVISTDSANNTSQLMARINFVKNKLLGY